MLYKIQFDAIVKFTDMTGVSIENLSAATAASITVMSASGQTHITIDADWSVVGVPDLFDDIVFIYDGSGNFTSDNGIDAPAGQCLLKNNHIDADAHFMHFPMTETSGQLFTDVITGMVMDKGSAQDFTKPYAPGMDIAAPSFTQPMALPKMDQSGGMILFYWCIDMWHAGDPRLDPYRTGKLSLQHFLVGQCTFDIQTDLDNETHFATVSEDHRRLSGFNPAYTPYGSLRLGGGAGTDSNLFEYKGGNASGAIACDLGKAWGVRQIRDDGTIIPFTLGGNAASQPTISEMSFSELEASGYTQFAPTGAFEASYKYMDLFASGAYYFTEDVPNDAEIIDFLEWMEVQHRAGNKERYPNWVGRR